MHLLKTESVRRQHRWADSPQRSFHFRQLGGKQTASRDGAICQQRPHRRATRRVAELQYLHRYQRQRAFDAGEPTAPAALNLAGSIAPISRAVLDGFIPLPNDSIIGANYIANGIQKMDEDAFTIRTDHSLTKQDQVSVRYADDDQRQFYPSKDSVDNFCEYRGEGSDYFYISLASLLEMESQERSPKDGRICCT